MLLDLDPFFLIGLFGAIVVVPLWFLRTVRVILFYLYLWQLKEYHVGRFLDHFRTSQGKRLLFNKVLLVKIALLFLAFPLLLIFWYILELCKAAYDLLKGRVRKPVFTNKTILLLGLSLTVFAALGVFVLFWAAERLISPRLAAGLILLFDILTPVIVSAVVLLFQPFAVLGRNRILKKAREKRAGMKNLKVVGITGSYGKTSTKEFLAHILSAKFTVLKTPEHMNSEVGIARTILRSLTPEHQVFVCEMGAYSKGGIKLLANIAKPDIGMVTGVNEQHLATFGSRENLLSAEGGKELADALPDRGALFVNQNSRLRSSSYGGQAKIKYYGEAENISVEQNKVSFAFEGMRFEVPAYGRHNVENLLGAIMVARELGMSLEQIAKAASTIPLELSALKVKKSKEDVVVVDSTYSANPDGVLADLEYLRLYKGRKALIMPCLIELGSAAKEAHKRIGQKAADTCDLVVITTKEHFGDVKEGANGADQVIYMEDASGIMEKIKEMDVILLEGGKESRLQKHLLGALQK